MDANISVDGSRNNISLCSVLGCVDKCMWESAYTPSLVMSIFPQNNLCKKKDILSSKRYLSKVNKGPLNTCDPIGNAQ